MSEVPLTSEPDAAGEPPVRHLRAVDTPPEGVPAEASPVEAAPAAEETAPRWGSPIDPDAGLEPAGDVLGAGDLVSEPTGGPVDAHLVPVPASTGVQRLRALRDVEAVPLVPAWVRDATVRREAARRVGRDALNVTVLGLRMAPRVAFLALVWFVRGLSLVVYRVVRWAWDVDGHPRYGAQPAQTDKAYDAMAQRRSGRQKARFTALGLVLGVAAVAGVTGWFLARWTVVLAAVVLAAALVWAGKPAGTTFVSPGVLPAQRARLTSQAVVRALSALGISELTKALTGDSTGLWRSAFVTVRGGHRVHLQLPGSVTADQITPHELRLASALQRPADCVVVEPLPHVTPGDLNLWVFDRPILSTPRGVGPLATARKASWWEPVELGLTRTGQPFTMHLRGGAWFLGGMPSSGKSSTAKVAAAQTVLDPNALLIVNGLKGVADWAWCKPVAHRFVCGAPETDPTLVPRSVALIRWLLAETARRNDFLGKLVEAGKTKSTDVTPELAAKYPQLRPITAIFDEIHRLINKSDNPEMEETIELLEKLIKACRSSGITFIGITQLAGTESIPAALTRAARVRGCLRVEDEVSWRQIFGTAGKGSFAAARVSSLTPGTVILRAEDSSAVKVGSYDIAPALEDIGRRALALRTNLHTLTGEAAGEKPQEVVPTDPADLLRHVLDVISATAPDGDDDAAWTTDLETVLAARHPAVYGDRADGWINNELRTRNVTVAPIGRRWTEDGQARQRSTMGIRRACVVTALETLLDQQG